MSDSSLLVINFFFFFLFDKEGGGGHDKINSFLFLGQKYWRIENYNGNSQI